MNTLQGLLVAYALLGFCCAAIEITSTEHLGSSVTEKMGAFLVTALIWPVWIYSVAKDALEDKRR